MYKFLFYFVLFYFCYNIQLLARVNNDSLIIGNWQEIFYLNTSIEYSEVIYNKDLNIQKYQERIFSSPMMDCSFFSFQKDKTGYINSYLYSHYELNSYKEKVDFNDIYAKGFSIKFINNWSLEKNTLLIEIQNNKSIEYDVLFICEELFVLGYYNKKELVIRVFRNLIYNPKKINQLKDKDFIPFYLKKYIDDKNIQIKIE